MKTKIEELQNKFHDLSKKVGAVTGEYNYLQKAYEESSTKLEKLKNDLDTYQKAVELLQLVSGATREKTKKQFEDLVTSGLQFVFGEGHCFKIEFDRRGNLTTLDFKIVTPEHDEPCNPLDCESGGIIDLISLILRIVIMETSNPKTKGFIVLDENLKGLDKVRLPKAGEFIKQLSDKLGRQIIFISHEDYIIDSDFNKIEVK